MPLTDIQRKRVYNKTLDLKKDHKLILAHGAQLLLILPHVI